jgi:hypothetical protein
MKNKTACIPTPPEQRTEPYWKILNDIIDPEIGVGIIDLGLIYTIEIKQGTAVITMTFYQHGLPGRPKYYRTNKRRDGKNTWRKKSQN